MPRRKSPLTTAVDVTKGTAAIGKMVVGQVARTALSAAGGAVGAVTERAGRRKVAHTSGPATTPAPSTAPATPPDLRAVPEPAPVKTQGDPVAPATKTATKAAAKKAPAKKVPAKKTPVKKAAAKKAPATKAPAKKDSVPTPADVAKVAGKQLPAKKAAPAKTAAEKPAKKAPEAPGDRLPPRKAPAQQQEQNPEAR